jgi:hypothetical protein
MKNFVFVALVATLGFIGCATSSQGDMVQAQKELAETRQLLAQVQASAGKREASPAPETRAKEVSIQRLRASGYILPDAPPSNVGFLHRPPKECERGPYALVIDNPTESFASVVLDGRTVRVFGADDELPPLIPPYEKIYVCLDEIGMHGYRITLFGARGRQLKKQISYQKTVTYTNTPNGWGRQHFTIHERGF